MCNSWAIWKNRNKVIHEEEYRIFNEDQTSGIDVVYETQLGGLMASCYVQTSARGVISGISGSFGYGNWTHLCQGSGLSWNYAEGDSSLVYHAIKQGEMRNPIIGHFIHGIPPRDFFFFFWLKNLLFLRIVLCMYLIILIAVIWYCLI